MLFSTDGTSFSSLGTYSVTNDGWNTTLTPAASEKGPFAAPAAADDQALVYFRLAQLDAVSINGATVAGTGTSRVDNVTITGTLVPEPASLSVLALGGLMLGRRRRA